MTEQPDYESKAPKYTFADTLEEQEEQLAANPTIKRFAESRAAMSDDPHRPVCHFVSPENAMNDPNGLCFWQGRWHLFYQGYPAEHPREHWGHAVSDDLIHWRDLPYAIYPKNERACYSGATFVEDDRVIAMYHGTFAGNMIAMASDPLLLNWTKLTDHAVIPGSRNPDGSHIPTEMSLDPNLLPYTVFDPCIWKKGNMYYSLSAGRQGTGPDGKPLRANYLFRSKDMATWEYLHPFVEGDCFTLVGDDGACPYFWPIGDRHILLFFSHMSGGQYLLGDYDTERDKFVVTSHGKFNFGAVLPCGVHAPSATPDGNGGVIVIFNMNHGTWRLPAEDGDWNQIMTLPRRLTLTGRDELAMEPAGDVESLRRDHRHVDMMTLPSNQEVMLEGITGNVMEIVAEIDTQGSPMVELNVLCSPGKQEYVRIAFFRERGFHPRQMREGPPYSLVSIDSSYASTLPDVESRPPETAPVLIHPDEMLQLRIFIDRSVVEVFVNGRQCLALRVYPAREDSVGVSLRSQGNDAVLASLDAWQMASIYR